MWCCTLLSPVLAHDTWPDDSAAVHIGSSTKSESEVGCGGSPVGEVVAALVSRQRVVGDFVMVVARLHHNIHSAPSNFASSIAERPNRE